MQIHWFAFVMHMKVVNISEILKYYLILIKPKERNTSSIGPLSLINLTFATKLSIHFKKPGQT